MTTTHATYLLTKDGQLKRITITMHDLKPMRPIQPREGTIRNGQPAGSSIAYGTHYTMGGWGT